MVNKQGLWFLTLISLALVLSVYYITMPNELLLTNNSNFASNDKESTNEVSNNNVDITESDVITSMRVELEEERQLLQTELQEKLNDKTLSVDEKNKVYEDIQNISKLSTMEETIEKKIKDEFSLNSFVKISDDIVDVVINSKTHDSSLAVNIMKCVGEEFEDKMYFSVSFKE